jgi:hypothetical protein
MTYLPVYCEACAHASLSSPTSSEGERQVTCSFCEGPARVIPGPVYGDGDWLAFADIDDAVYSADLDGVRASMLADALQDLLDDAQTPTAIVQVMIEKLPALAKARPALVNRLPRGLRMLKTLLVARSRDLPIKSGPHVTADFDEPPNARAKEATER